MACIQNLSVTSCRLFKLDPTVKSLFESNGLGMKIHGRRIVEFMDMSSIMLGSDVDTLASFLSSMGARHKSRGVTKDHFSHFGKALCNVMKERIDDGCWNEETEAACEALFSQMIACMLRYM